MSTGWGISFSLNFQKEIRFSELLLRVIPIRMEDGFGYLSEIHNWRDCTFMLQDVPFSYNKVPLCNHFSSDSHSLAWLRTIFTTCFKFLYFLYKLYYSLLSSWDTVFAFQVDGVTVKHVFGLRFWDLQLPCPTFHAFILHLRVPWSLPADSISW